MEQKVGSPEWLVSEILRFLGEAVVVEPRGPAQARRRAAAKALLELAGALRAAPRFELALSALRS